MKLPWAKILRDTDTIRFGDFTTRKSVFWEDGWDPAPEDCIGRTVAECNAKDLDGKERVWVRPR